MTTAEALQGLLAQLVRLAPRAGAVLLLLLLGLVLSLVLRSLARWLTVRSGLEAFAEKLGASRALYALGVKRGLGAIMGSFAFYAGLLLTAAAAAELLGLPGIAAATGAVMAYLPRLAAAALALLGGVWLASVLRAVVSRMARGRDDLDAPRLPGEVVYYAVLTVALTLAAGQAGLETDLVEALVLIVVGVGSISFGLAFALGSRAAIDNLVLRHYYERTLRPGDAVRVGAHEGTVLRFNAVALILETPEGERVIPCSRLLEQEVLRKRRSPPIGEDPIGEPRKSSSDM